MGAEDRIVAYEKEMTELLQALVKIPSVRAEAQPEAPFGLDVAESLRLVLDWGEREGFQTRNINGYAGHIEYGQGEELIGVLAHVDVVPAGEGWTYPPFGAEIHDGKIYGRGVTDDKGPAVAVLYALKALKEEGTPVRRRIRIILGCDEESRWECMDAYFKAEPKPTMGFTPDAVFPLVFSEKGRLGLTVAGTVKNGHQGIQLLSLQGGSRANVVPDQATAMIKVEEQKLLENIERVLGGHPSVQSTPNPTGLTLKAKGIAAHASMPELGDNALGKMLMALADLELSGGTWDTIRSLAEWFGAGFDGDRLGIAAKDAESGALTMNLGVLDIQSDQVRLEIDIRYPRTVSGEALVEQLRQTFDPLGLKPIDTIVMPPHFVAPDHPLVQNLLDAYRQETGDQSAPIAIGGRTYATVLGTAVAFGPGFPGEPDLAHQRDEFMAINDLIRCGRIYARALEGLMTT